MSRVRVRLAAVSSSLLVGFAVTGTGVASPPDSTVVDDTTAAVPESIVVAGTAAASSTPGSAAVEIVPPDEPYGGATLSEWGARWWQWWHSTPEDVHPGFDTTGERCGYGQSGPVFFLPLNFGGASPREFPCVVAEGTAIYVWVSGNQCSSVEEPPFFGGTEEELRACASALPASSAAGADELTSFEARVNGQEVAEIDAYRTASLFTLTFPENNVLGVEPGVAQAASEQYGFIIAPPPPGEYVIDVSTTFEGETGAYTMTVIVEAPRVSEPGGPAEAPPVTPDVTEADSALVGSGSSERLTQRPVGTTDAPLGYYEYLPPDYDDDGSSPLLVFLHGYGESGGGSADELEILLATGIPQLIGNDEWPSERPFVVLAPQHAYPHEEAHYAPCDGVVHGGSCAMTIEHELGHPENGSICMTPAEIHDFLSYAIGSYDIDPNRVYLTGLSCGAYGAWEYVAEYGGDQIAAMVPIAGEGRPAWEAAMCSLGEVAMWAFHGDADDVVAPAGSIETLNNLEECPQRRRDAELTVYPGVDHDSWTRTYDQSAGHDIYDWLLGFTVSDPPLDESTGTTTSEDTVTETSLATPPATVTETST
jgi:dienelactone hydrolase